MGKNSAPPRFRRTQRRKKPGAGWKINFNDGPPPRSAGKWESSTQPRHSPPANAVLREKTSFSARKHHSPRENAILREKTPFSARKRRSPPENAVLREKSPFSARKRRSPPTNAVYRRKMGKFDDRTPISRGEPQGKLIKRGFQPWKRPTGGRWPSAKTAVHAASKAWLFFVKISR